MGCEHASSVVQTNSQDNQNYLDKNKHEKQVKSKGQKENAVPKASIKYDSIKLILTSDLKSDKKPEMIQDKQSIFGNNNENKSIQWLRSTYEKLLLIEQKSQKQRAQFKQLAKSDAERYVNLILKQFKQTKEETQSIIEEEKDRYYCTSYEYTPSQYNEFIIKRFAITKEEVLESIKQKISILKQYKQHFKEIILEFKQRHSQQFLLKSLDLIAHILSVMIEDKMLNKKGIRLALSINQHSNYLSDSIKRFQSQLISLYNLFKQ